MNSALKSLKNHKSLHTKDILSIKNMLAEIKYVDELSPSEVTLFYQCYKLPPKAFIHNEEVRMCVYKNYIVKL